jgi:hypothetical protein
LITSHNDFGSFSGGNVWSISHFLTDVWYTLRKDNLPEKKKSCFQVCNLQNMHVYLYIYLPWTYHFYLCYQRYEWLIIKYISSINWKIVSNFLIKWNFYANKKNISVVQNLWQNSKLKNIKKIHFIKLIFSIFSIAKTINSLIFFFVFYFSFSSSE